MSKRKPVINSPSEIPKFANEDEEVEWWESHTLSEEFFKQLRPPSPRFQELLRRHREAVGRTDTAPGNKPRTA